MNREERASQEQIAATIAHEIKNPLQLIKSTLQYIELSDRDKVFKKNYEVMYREIDRINEIVVDYMSAASPDRLKLRKFKISRLFDDISDIFTCDLQNKGIKLGVYLPEEISIRADYDKIKQVMINLIQNSKEAMEPGGHIDISAFKQDGFVNIAVKDNGYGIQEKNLAFVGRPFFTTKEAGTGLGISICQSIIKKHKGSLKIAGIEGKGTTATISLPAVIK